MTWTRMHIMWWLGQEGWHHWEKCTWGHWGYQQEEPAPTVRLGEKPAAKLGTWWLRNRPNRLWALLGSKTYFWSHQVVTEAHIHCSTGLSLTPGPGRAEPVGNSSSPHRRMVWGMREQDENCLWWRQTHWKDANKCNGIIQSWIMK